MCLISPNYKNSDFTQPLTLNDKITIFSDRIIGWQFKIAEFCSIYPNSDKAIFHIIACYFENISKFQDGYKGDRKPSHYFESGILSVFPYLQKWGKDFIKTLSKIFFDCSRNGMYHCGITSKYVELDLGCEKPIDIVVDTEKIAINPILMTQHLKNHFLEYERKLREPENSKLRENFESRFDTFSSSKNDQDEFFTKFFLSQE